jgi:hypothetical protein
MPLHATISFMETGKLDVGCWMLDVGCWMFQAGIEVSDASLVCAFLRKGGEGRSQPDLSLTNEVSLAKKAERSTNFGQRPH